MIDRATYAFSCDRCGVEGLHEDILEVIDEPDDIPIIYHMADLHGAHWCSQCEADDARETAEIEAIEQASREQYEDCLDDAIDEVDNLLQSLDELAELVGVTDDPAPQWQASGF